MRGERVDDAIVAVLFSSMGLLFLIAAAKAILIGSGALTGESAWAWGVLACVAACYLNKMRHDWRNIRRLEREYEALVRENATWQTLLRDVEERS